MISQEVVTYKQKPVKIIKDQKTLKIFQDENLMIVLKFLKKGPKTIQDLVEDFKEYNDEKSDKTIYRYLHKLIQVKLVAKAGKRVTSKDEEDLVSETIYLRTAKAFITVNPIDDRECKGGAECPVWEATRLLVGQFFDSKGDKEGFAELASNLDRDIDNLVIQMFEKADEETLDKIADLDWAGINHVMQFSGWLAMATKKDLPKELEKVYKS